MDCDFHARWNFERKKRKTHLLHADGNKESKTDSASDGSLVANDKIWET